MDEDLTIADVARIKKVSTDTVRRRIADGTLPAVRIGRLIRIPRSAVDSWGRPVTIARRNAGDAA